MKVEIAEIRKRCTDIVLALDVGEEDAKTIVDEYLYGEMAGKKSHGLCGFPKIKQKLLAVSGNPVIEKEDESYALINGKNGLGSIVGKYAMDLAISKAKNKGISLVGMHDMQSYITPGYYAKTASDQGMIGIVIDNARSVVAPYGGIDPRLGTNPIGLSVPTKEGDLPLIIDMATSKRAFREISLSKELGKNLPSGMSIDKEGRPTRDPDESYALNPAGEYKGYALAVAIEILAGSFVRAKMGSEIKSKTNRGFLFIAIDPTIFVDLETFKNEVSVFLNEIKTSKKRAGVDEILIPGERAARNLAECKKTGFVDIDDKLYEKIIEMKETRDFHNAKDKQ